MALQHSHQFRVATLALLGFVLLAGSRLCAADADSTYHALLSRLKAGDTAINFTDLRMAYADSRSYSPYGTESTTARSEASGLIRDGKFEKARAVASGILDSNYLDIDAQWMVAFCYQKLGDAERSRYHVAIARGLVRSILRSGNGTTAATAFEVISVDEEYALLGGLGYQLERQSLIAENGHTYDKMEVVEKQTKEKRTFYFNIDRPMKSLHMMLKED